MQKFKIKTETDTQVLFLTFAGQFGGSKTQPEHRAVGNQPVFKFVDPFVTHRVMAEVQSLQTLGAWLGAKTEDNKKIREWEHINI